MPSYDARVLSTERAVNLGYFGVVRQSTGEDWTDVRLALSTAQPSIGGRAPSPERWRLSFAPKYAEYRGTKGGGQHTTLVSLSASKHVHNENEWCTSVRADLAQPDAGRVRDGLPANILTLHRSSVVCGDRVQRFSLAKRRPQQARWHR